MGDTVVGFSVGDCDGFAVARATVGFPVGIPWLRGEFDGLALEGICVGELVASVGTGVGGRVGVRVGANVGGLVGLRVGFKVGDFEVGAGVEGDLDGISYSEGPEEGILVKVTPGGNVGLSVGNVGGPPAEGRDVGEALGRNPHIPELGIH